jgi:hypothetical protein
MMHRTKRINRWLSIGLLLALLAGACAPQTPAPTAPPPTQTAVAEPTAPPPPTATPLPLPAPRLLSRSPAPGEAQPPDSPLELTFDQPMDRPSVEAGLSISPAVRGSFSWTGERTLRFTPAEPLERGAGYEVTVAATARNVEGAATGGGGPFCPHHPGLPGREPGDARARAPKTWTPTPL